ncbi:tRNA 2-thiouridine(34) synthase MnmA [Candidatus Pacearchaeota archaeon]|nr:tRNA 2-thiouridine(34) synthase MnmA [Candidatus Pacearchaeota archaeon]|tara:strand:- start:2134 stop:3240 length:1107 start_codon:yes stop_codon:yes gene_type:complete
MQNSKPTKKTVVLGMSGGVDSSVAALLLKKQGYKVVGIFLRNYPDTEPYLDSICPFKGDKEIAERVCQKLNIPFRVIDYRKQYLKDVIEPMFKSYESGLTPNPDVCCNNLIKFPALWKFAKSISADFIATGHYAQVKKTSKGFQLLSGKDKTKDQSYFLHELTQSDLSHTIFPLGELTKSQVRKIAKSHKLKNWNKQGSRGVCFIGDLDFKSFLKKKIKKSLGVVLTPEGETIGSHPGAFYFTIGERVRPNKGIEINDKYRNSIDNKKLYIAKKKGNTLIVVPEKSPLLLTKKVFIKNLKPINKKNFSKTGLRARIRHLGSLIPGKLKKEKSKYTFTFNKGIKEVASGQSIVLYKGKILIAAGIIKTQ